MKSKENNKTVLNDTDAAVVITADNEITLMLPSDHHVDPDATCPDNVMLASVVAIFMDNEDNVKQMYEYFERHLEDSEKE